MCIRDRNQECFSELLIIAEFFFAILSHNANTERVFSLMQSQWTKERNKLHIESMKGILFVQYNFKHLSCRDFYACLCSQPKLLKEIRSSDKYTWSQTRAQPSSSLTVSESQEQQGDWRLPAAARVSSWHPSLIFTKLNFSSLCTRQWHIQINIGLFVF